MALKKKTRDDLRKLLVLLWLSFLSWYCYFSLSLSHSQYVLYSFALCFDFVFIFICNICWRCYFLLRFILFLPTMVIKTQQWRQLHATVCCCCSYFFWILFLLFQFALFCTKCCCYCCCLFLNKKQTLRGYILMTTVVIH